MSADREPWWSSGVGPEADAHADAAGSAERPGPDPDTAAGGRTAPHAIDACGVCPICVALRLLGDTRPELFAHLAEAARHLAAAARTLVDDQHAGGTSSGGHAPHDRVRRIDLD